MNDIISLPLAERILAELARKPSQKAAEIAATLGVDRRDVNRCLSHQLAGKVQQNEAYRWSLRGAAPARRESSAEPVTEIARMMRYYLECIGQDSDTGVSTFAANRYGPPDYVELPSIPLPGTTEDWWNAPGAERVLGKVRADRNRLIAYVGYPVRLRKHRTANWEGFFVDPVMLWPIELPAEPGDPYRLQDELPTPNFAFLRSLAMGDSTQLMEEATRLANDLGLSNSLDDQPEVDELLVRLGQMRPDWDWVEPIDLDACSTETPLSELQEQGIYNRAIILTGERSPYTLGLESELKQLAGKDERALTGTALGAWLTGTMPPAETVDQDPLLEVLPMNSEQREAVRSALGAPLTVVTGPPGTGKSQVVTNLLVNAAWRGKKVLFASKNNKAVDVVEARVNGLGNRPVLLRMGSKEYQAKLGGYLTSMLSGTVTKDDELSYQEGLDRHGQIASRIRQLDETQNRTLQARNRTDQLDAAAEDHRRLFGAERFNALDGGLLEAAPTAIAAYRQVIAAADTRTAGFIGRLFGRLNRTARYAALSEAATNLMRLAQHLGVSLPRDAEVPAFDEHSAAANDLERRIAAGKQVLTYQHALEVLRSSPPFEEIARQRQQLGEQLAKNCAGLWRDYVQLAPKRLSSAERKDVSDYAALLQLINGPESQTISSTVKTRAKALQQKVTKLFSCWAVTSLSARGKVPFEPAYFDLVVIDEASQCDIASALPLLYRAKRAVIIGDPMQLRHISSLTRQKESELQQKYDLVQNRAAWMYSVNSLYDLAAGVAESENIVNLRDHHRSHADIIEYANEHFYQGRLRVATKYSALKRPSNTEPGVVWQDVKGKVMAPRGGGASNPQEAAAVVAALRDLLVTRGYTGSVGVVTPFRAQVASLQRAVAEDPQLTAAAARAELLVDTVHKFQGDERDVMFFSPVVAEGMPQGGLSFLRANGNLFNVAITRARGLLHVVGDRAAASNCGIDYLASFSQHVELVATARRKQDDGQPDEEDLGGRYPTVSNPERVSEWEHRLYEALYRAGLRPVPQFSVEQYDLDFALFDGDRRLNIEVDGEKYHRSWTGELCHRDQLRNQRLIELGWEVKRFWVPEIRDRLEDCVAAIKKWQGEPTA
jgi:very-short-patch-repair endonuclease